MNGQSYNSYQRITDYETLVSIYHVQDLIDVYKNRLTGLQNNKPSLNWGGKEDSCQS